ncbi:MAG TPA: L,D-transpeptidase family protein [Gemmatimonadales bacterium]|nr:L,D-transpeptidase family protein [Gemmatimonadales bacterium]
MLPLLLGLAAAPLPVRAQDSTATAIRTVVTAARHPWSRYPEFPRFIDDLLRLYTARADQPLWLDGAGRLDRAGQAALAELRNVRDDGLDPVDYDVPTLDSLARRLDPQAANALTPADRGRFDALLSVAYVRYLGHLHAGRRPPAVPLGGPELQGPRPDYAAALAAAVAGDSVARLARAMAPQLVQYRNLRLALARWRALAADSAPLAPRVRQLELALERLRWLPPIGRQRFIVVNIPAFELFAFDSTGGAGLPALQMPVIVGRALNTRTPMLLQAMRYIDFRPYWNVPRSILVKEILPALRKNANYLRRNDMEVVGARDRVLGDTPTPAVLQGLERGELRVRQRPGPANSLGLAKFVFPNAADVYLHGTPNPGLFARTRRDFSHGCVRVFDPAGLAEWVLRDQPGWSRARIDSAMAGKTTTRVLLSKPMPVVVFYTTAVVWPDGRTVFYPDIYGHDATLDRAMRAGPTVP